MLVGVGTAILKAPAFARIAPFAVYILLLAFNRPLTDAVSAVGGDVRWLYAVRIGMVVWLLLWFWRCYRELLCPPDMPARTWLVSLLVGLGVFALWVLPYPAWAMLGGVGEGFDPTRAGAMDWGVAGIRIFGAALVVPLMEELFWRSFLMRWLDRADFTEADPARVSWRAFAITAVLFGIEHNLWLAGLLAGLAYNWLYKKYRNLWAPVLAHAVTNGLLGAWVLHTSEWQYW